MGGTANPSFPYTPSDLVPSRPKIALNQGRYAEAKPLYKRSLAINEKALGPEHPDIATSLENYAGMLPLVPPSLGAYPRHECAPGFK